MFQLAGFNGNCRSRRIAFAKVSRRDRTWVRRAELLQFACGDFAWYGPQGSGKCPKCEGSGHVYHYLPTPMPVVSGRVRNEGGTGTRRTCPRCFGSGMCPACKGSKTAS